MGSTAVGMGSTAVGMGSTAVGMGSTAVGMGSTGSLIDRCHLRHSIAVILSEAKDPTEQHLGSLADGSTMVERPTTYHVYMVTGLSLNRVLYIGVTSQLAARIDGHRRRKADGFTARHCLWRLVYAEAFAYVRDAIAREKELKGWRRERKIALIEFVNPAWDELRFDGNLPGRKWGPSLRSG